ncbi:MAG: hypothetical protein IJS22_05295 [Lachnospiraceae bacterium]|nr:hypothetical protein [Lachnospiraceae bacterium]
MGIHGGKFENAALGIGRTSLLDHEDITASGPETAVISLLDVYRQIEQMRVHADLIAYGTLVCFRCNDYLAHDNPPKGLCFLSISFFEISQSDISERDINIQHYSAVCQYIFAKKYTWPQALFNMGKKG